MSSVDSMDQKYTSERFIFTWKIENFSMCPLKFGEFIQSPCFVVETMNGTKWKLNLYPRGSNDFNFVACFLESCNACEETASYSLMLVADGDTKTKKGPVQERVFTSANNAWGWDSFIPRNVLFDQSDKYLMNDVLTLRCCMWSKSSASNKTPQEIEKVIYKELYTNFFRDDLLHPGMREGMSRTTINVRKKLLTWPIRNFSSLYVNRRLTMSLATPLVDVPSFFLTVNLIKGESNEKLLQIELRRKNRYQYTQVFLKCHVFILDHSDKTKYDTEKSHLFVSGSASENSWKFPAISLSTLGDDKYFKLTGDVLKLKFEFSFSYNGDKHNTEDVSIIAFADHYPNFNEPDPLVNEFNNLYLNNEFTDVTLKAVGKTFNAHKLILSAYSPIFKSLFNHESIKDTGSLKISLTVHDFSAASIKNMLSFMYTKALGKLGVPDAKELYSLAEKYQVLKLKTQCSSTLSSLLSVANFYDVLEFADKHNDESLRDAVLNFISLNAREILKSSEWMSYMVSDSTLAAKVMHYILVKSMGL